LNSARKKNGSDGYCHGWKICYKRLSHYSNKRDLFSAEKAPRKPRENQISHTPVDWKTNTDNRFLKAVHGKPL